MINVSTNVITDKSAAFRAIKNSYSRNFGTLKGIIIFCDSFDVDLLRLLLLLLLFFDDFQSIVW